MPRERSVDQNPRCATTLGYALALSELCNHMPRVAPQPPRSYDTFREFWARGPGKGVIRTVGVRGEWRGVRGVFCVGTGEGD